MGSEPRVDIVPLQGGVDAVTTPILVPPGKLLSSNNFEPDIFGGYRRMGGIERFDGRTSPTDAPYYVLRGTITGTINVNDTVVGDTSGATGKVLYINAAITPDEVVITRLTGTFVAETIKIGAATVAIITDITMNGASNVQDHANFRALTAAEYRGDIVKVPGSGPVRGVWEYLGDIYALRDNVGATACIMHKATTSGWSAIAFGVEVQFDGAVAEISEGQTVVGQTSLATGVVRRALLRTGTWAVSGVGTLFFDTLTGSFIDNENIQVGGVTKVIANGVSSDVTLAPGGRFVFDNHNFSGTIDKYRMYFADGKNFVSEFDGTRIVPIRTGISDDKPSFVVGHRNHLVIGIQSSLQLSSIGNPYAWTALTGASELALGDTITNVVVQRGDGSTGVLLVTTRNHKFVLYGTSTADFKLIQYADDTGAYAYTVQNIDYAYYLDDRGIAQLAASQNFGGFQLGVLSNPVQPTIDTKRTLAVASCVAKSKNQYRLFFSDGTGMILNVASADGASITPGALMPFDYSLVTNMFNVFSYVATTGKERIFGAGADGFVYELDKGTSMDGADIDSHILMVFNYMKSPYLRKRFRRAVLQFRTDGVVNVSIGYDLTYGHVDTAVGNSQNVTGGGFWDSFTWDSFTWDGSYLQEFNLDIPGVGENLSLLVRGLSNRDEAYTIHTLIVNYSLGRMQR